MSENGLSDTYYRPDANEILQEYVKAEVAFLTDKVNAAIIANEPSSKVIFNQKGIPAIKISALNYNTVTAPLARITEENQEAVATTGA